MTSPRVPIEVIFIEELEKEKRKHLEGIEEDYTLIRARRNKIYALEREIIKHRETLRRRRLLTHQKPPEDGQVPLPVDSESQTETLLLRPTIPVESPPACGEEDQTSPEGVEHLSHEV